MCGHASDAAAIRAPRRTRYDANGADAANNPTPNPGNTPPNNAHPAPTPATNNTNDTATNSPTDTPTKPACVIQRPTRTDNDTRPEPPNRGAGPTPDHPNAHAVNTKCTP